MERVLHSVADILASFGPRRWLLSRPLPPRHETLAAPGCREAIDVRIDAHGVPHVHADHADDLFFAQGYCHARDRLWQMELNRRAANGELAEIFGAVALEADRMLRRLGFRHDAEREFGTVPDATRGYLTAYAAGANAYIERHRLPIEFTLLRFRPRPWQPVDSLAFARYMGFTLTYNWETELIRSRLIAVLGKERAAALEAGREGIPAPPEASGVNGFAPSRAAPSGIPLANGGASNNWVVSGARSTTGRPLLANDPHLRPRIPPFWYMVHLRGGDFDVAGASLPGALGVLVGHNDRVAWGITSAIVDCQDLFVERADPGQPRRFAHGDDWYDAEVRREEIRVKGSAEPVIEDVVVTRHGPLLNGLLDIPAEPPLSLCCVTRGTASAVEAILSMNRASDAAAFRAALSTWSFPSLNFVFADTAGHIGYQLAGTVPIRAKGDGAAPVPGAEGTHDWTGHVPFDALPAAQDPPDGQWSTANSRPDAPCSYFLAKDWLDDGRQRRIQELLRAKDKHSLADFETLQNDVVSLTAQRVWETLRKGTTPRARELAEWDGRLHAESCQASIYHVFRRELLRQAHRDLPEPLVDYVLGKGISETLSFASVFHGRASEFLVATLDNLLAADREDVIDDALRNALAWLRERLGPDPAQWHWGRLHQVEYGHVIGRAMPLLDRALGLSRGPFPVGGDTDTVAQAGVDPWHPYNAATFTVSYRQIFDVGDWDAGRFILPTGQSGHPGSEHYDDMTGQWLRGEYRPLLFGREAIEAATAETIRIDPWRAGSR